MSVFSWETQLKQKAGVRVVQLLGGKEVKRNKVIIHRMLIASKPCSRQFMSIMSLDYTQERNTYHVDTLDKTLNPRGEKT